jgi:hypothetical protein
MNKTGHVNTFRNGYFSPHLEKKTPVSFHHSLASEEDREASAVSGEELGASSKQTQNPSLPHPPRPGLHGGEFSPISKSDIVSTPAMTARDNGPCMGG